MAMACPMCKEALIEPGGLGQRLAAARGYAASILLLLTVPSGLIAAIAAIIVRAQRLTSRRRVGAGAPTTWARARPTVDTPEPSR